MTTPDISPAPSATAKRLFLVRHGEVINPGGDRPVYYGGQDVPLSPLGQLEAKAAADYLESFELAAVFSSPLSRAKYGAEQVLSRQSSAKASVTLLEGLRELVHANERVHFGHRALNDEDFLTYVQGVRPLFAGDPQ